MPPSVIKQEVDWVQTSPCNAVRTGAMMMRELETLTTEEMGRTDTARTKDARSPEQDWKRTIRIDLMRFPAHAFSTPGISQLGRRVRSACPLLAGRPAPVKTLYLSHCTSE